MWFAFPVSRLRGLQGISRRFEGARRLRDELRKRLWVAHCHLGHDFAIQADAGLGEALDEAAVLYAFGAAGGADAYDPQSAEVTLLVAPVAIGVVARLQHLLVGGLEQAALTAPVAFGF